MINGLANLRLPGCRGSFLVGFARLGWSRGCLTDSNHLLDQYLRAFRPSPTTRFFLPGCRGSFLVGFARLGWSRGCLTDSNHLLDQYLRAFRPSPTTRFFFFFYSSRLTNVRDILSFSFQTDYRLHLYWIVYASHINFQFTKFFF